MNYLGAEKIKKSAMAEEPPTIKELEATLTNPKCPIGKRMDAVFYLKYHGGEEAIKSLSKGLVSDSVLLNHEICYVMGQMQDPKALPILNKVLDDEKEHAVVRHEAAEALGAIGLEESLERLEKHATSKVTEIAETCVLAIDTIKFKLAEKKRKEKINNSEAKKKEDNEKKKYLSVDPAPPSRNKATTEQLTQTLTNTSKSLFERYRAMFALRDMGTKEAVEGLAKAFDDKSPVVRHEIAYVMGQMRNPQSIPHLRKVLENNSEHAMVRHEAAEALGSISTAEAVGILEGYKNDKQRIVSESCKVALDIADDWTDSPNAGTD